MSQMLDLALAKLLRGSHFRNLPRVWRCQAILLMYLRTLDTRPVSDLLRLSGEELRKIHVLRKDNIVLIELDAGSSLCLVCLISIDLQTQLLLSEHHVTRIVSKSHTSDLLVLNVSRLIDSQVIVLRLLLFLVGFEQVRNTLRCHTSIYLI